MLRLLWGVAALLGAWGPAEAQQVRELFRRVSPSVVLVRTVERGLAPEHDRLLPSHPFAPIAPAPMRSSVARAARRSSSASS